jgi:hypothetical protein
MLGRNPHPTCLCFCWAKKDVRKLEANVGFRTADSMSQRNIF